MPDQPAVRWLARLLVAASLLVPGRAEADRDAVDACIASSEDAQRKRAEGHLLVARVRASACLDARCPVEIRRDCDALLTTLSRLTPTVVVRVRDPAGADLTAATITLDGAVLALDGRAHAVDPGPHDVTATAPGFAPFTSHVVIEEGVIARVLELQLTPLAAVLPPAPPAPSRAPSQGTWLATGALGAVGVVGLSLFAGLGLAADADFRDLRAQCSPGCPADDVASIRRRFQTADVALTAGVVAVVGAAAVFLLGPRAHR